MRIAIGVLLGLLTVNSLPRAAAHAQSGTYYLCDSDERIEVLPTGRPIEAPCPGDPCLDSPYGLTFGPDRVLYITDASEDQVLRLHVDSGLLERFVYDDPATPGEDETGGLDDPRGLTFGRNGELLVCSSGNDRVNIYDPTSGEHKGDFTVDSPQDVVLYDGFLYVTSFGKDEVVKIDAADYARERALVASSSVFDRPRGITLGPDDLLYVVSYGTHSVVRFDPQADTYLDTFASSDVLTWPRFAQFGSDRNGDGYPELFVTNELSLFTTGVTVLDGNSGTFEFDDHSSGTHSRDLAFVPFTAVERPTVALRLNASQLSIANGDALEVTGILATGDDDVVLDILVWLRAEGEDPHWSTRLLEKPLPAELVIQRLVFAGIAGLGRVAEPGEYEFGLRVLDPRTGRLHSQAIVDLSILP